MKNYARVGSRNGRPAYRTAANFRFCRFAEAAKNINRKSRPKVVK